MNNLKITLTAGSLSGLTPGSGGAYTFIVDMLKSDGTPLNNGNVPNTTTLSVVPSGLTFILNVPINDGTFTINGVNIKIYNGSRDNCCVANYIYTINNVSSQNPPAVVGVLDGKRITEVNGTYYSIINSQYAKLSVLPSGNVKLSYTVNSRPADNGLACLPVTMFSYMTDQHNGELDALKSATGLALPKGTYLTLYTYWTDPAMFTKLSEVQGNELYQAWGQPPIPELQDSARNHSSGADWCSIEIY